ncbi:DUF6417 family protein [Streptomyces sp. cg36]|uniref:DUF6417 family protein n=1 Tax=Streptomyces sp. cg36 TaxID=3238798 RepID=UPI0034E1D20E
MRLRAEHWEALRTAAAGEAAEQGWVGPACGISAAVFRGLASLGLCEMAPPEQVPALGLGRQAGWAVRLTDDGHDALVYEALRNATPPANPATASDADAGRRRVGLSPVDMLVLRRYVAAAAALRSPPVKGLEKALLDAVQEAQGGRYVLWLTEQEVASVARAFFLERISGTSASANRLGREHGAIYQSGQNAR